MESQNKDGRGLMSNSKKFQSIFSKVKEEVLLHAAPSKKELLSETAFAQNLASLFSKHLPPEVTASITGSVAKRTFISGNNEVDLFLLFPKNVSKDDFESILISLLSKALPGVGYQLSYAEHPYLRFHYKNHRIDLVPAYKISNSSQMLSAVDRSILHTKFIRRALPSSSIPEVLLLKKFLKANSLYGAEIKIQGFSGYLCELLIVYFGSFVKMASFFASNKAPYVLDIAKFYSKDEYSILTKRFGFFVVIDPTDRDRNVSAAISRENLEKFQSLCKKFLKNPSKDLFLSTPPSFEECVSLDKSKFKTLISMPRPNVVADVLWGQIRKLMGQISSALPEYDATSIFCDDSRHLIRIFVGSGSDSFGGKITIRGPPKKMAEHIKKFKSSHKSAKFTFKGGYIFAQKSIPSVSISSALHRFFEKYSKTSNSHINYPPDLIVIESISKSKKKKTKI